MLRNLEIKLVHLINKVFFFLPPAILNWNLKTGKFELNKNQKVLTWYCIFACLNISIGIQALCVLAYSSLFQLNLTTAQKTILGVLSGLTLTSYLNYFLLYKQPSTISAISQGEYFFHNLFKSRQPI